MTKVWRRVCHPLVLCCVILALGGLPAGLPRPVQAAVLTGAGRLLAGGDKIDPALQPALAAAQQSGGMLSVIVRLRQQADKTLFSLSGQGLAVERALRAVRDSSQGALSGLLAARQAQGKVSRFESFWIFNGYSLSATVEVIGELAQRSEVLSISPDGVDIVPEQVAEANLAAIQAPGVWSLGYRGQGVVVASLDSGVDVSHPDLAGSYRGGSNSWFDPYHQHAAPFDASGHGTWTMGLLVGGETGGTRIGAAPGAQWISARIFDDAGKATATAIHLSFQWLLDPDGDPNTADAPAVVNNSWSFSAPGCDLSFEPDLAALRAAGVLPVFAAGNGGPFGGSSYSPANNPSALAVGAVSSSGVIFGSSSRGPSSCGGRSGPFPEVVAPGVGLRTSDLLGGYTTVSGTSLAAPQVAGVLALLLSAYPGLSAAQQEQALVQSAHDLGQPGPDESYGYGLVDALQAYQWLAAAPTPIPAAVFTLQLPMMMR